MVFPHMTRLLSGARHTSLKFVEEAAEGKQSEDNAQQKTTRDRWCGSYHTRNQFCQIQC